MMHSQKVMVEVSLIKVASPCGEVGVEMSKLKLLCLFAKAACGSEDYEYESGKSGSIPGCH